MDEISLEKGVSGCFTPLAMGEISLEKGVSECFTSLVMDEISLEKGVSECFTPLVMDAIFYSLVIIDFVQVKNVGCDLLFFYS